MRRQDRLDFTDHVLQWLVFPQPDHEPAGLLECRSVRLVARCRSFDLLPPKLAVRHWPRGVHRTSVPKATVYEDGDPAAGKHHVGFASKAWDWTKVFAET